MIHCMLCQYCWLNVQCCQGTYFMVTFCCIMEVHFEVYQGSFVETFQGYVRHCMSDIRKNFLGVNVTGTPGIRCNALPGNSFLLDLLHFFKWARANYHVSTYIVRFPPSFHIVKTVFGKSLMVYIWLWDVLPGGRGYLGSAFLLTLAETILSVREAEKARCCKAEIDKWEREIWQNCQGF